MRPSIRAVGVLAVVLAASGAAHANPPWAHGGANVHRNVNRNVNVHRSPTVNVHRNVNVNGVGYHGGVYRGAWTGRNNRWAPGGAIAAGAAIGVVGAATAAAWAPAPPHPGLCWFYTDSTQRNGFWDTCP